METTNPSPITVDPQDGEYISVVGDTYRLVITGEQTGGTFAIIDMVVPPGGGPGPHAHAEFQETFFIIEGEIVVRSEAGSYTARKGSLVTIPLGGVVHQFKNESDKVAHLLCLVVPAGMERFFREVGQPVAKGQLLPPPTMTPELQTKMQELAKRYGQQIYPPDYFDK